MRLLVLLVVIGLAATVWFQQIEMKRHHVRTDPAQTLAQMERKVNTQADTFFQSAQKWFERTRAAMGKQFGHIAKETDVKEDSTERKKRRSR